MATTAVYATDYPKWLYNEAGESKLVNSPGEEKELGDGWQIHPDKAKAEHIKKVNELRSKADEEKKKIDEKYAADKAKQEQDLAKQLEANNPKNKAAADAKAKADAEAKAKADKAAADQKAKDEAAKKAAEAKE